MNQKTPITLWTPVLIGMLSATLGCDGKECGEGTQDVDGVCVGDRDTESDGDSDGDDIPTEDKDTG